MPSVPQRGLCSLFVLLVLAQRAPAEDAFFEVPFNKLTITEGKFRRSAEPLWMRHNMRRVEMMQPFGILDGPGEIYLGRSVGSSELTLRRELQFREPPPPDGATPAKKPRPPAANDAAVAIRAPAGKEVTGSLFLPKGDASGMVRLRFRVEASKDSPKARQNFYLAKRDHYRRLQNLNVAGGAWFRQQAAAAHGLATGKPPLEPIASARRDEPDWRTQSEIERTFAVFSGGRAVSENLQLDRMLRATKPAAPSVDVKTLPGITVAEMDWSKLTKGIQPDVDPLAKAIPHDQHAVFFPSFAAMTTLIDEAASFGTPLLHVLQPRAEDAGSKQRYEKQLCLELSAVSRLLAPKVIRSVAITGSDPYLRTGTDVAMLFEASSPFLLRQHLALKHAAAVKSYPGCTAVKDRIGTVNVTGAVSPDRVIRSYTATFGNVVVVTNSLPQLKRLAATIDGKAKPLSALPEYTFFRHRYRRTDAEETAFLIVTDATIRRWCGPKWRIATSRRTRAWAVMAHYQAEHLQQIVSGTAKETALTTKLYVPDLGTLLLSPAGVTSSEYGALEFMTPIVELNLDRVTKDEAEEYRRWRDGYQQNWRQYFDPIAVRFTVQDKRVAADVTVMPLIQNSDYNEFLELAAGAKIKPNAGDRHAGTLLHWSLAIDAKAVMTRRVAGFLPLNPLSWMGESISVYAEPDKFWLQLAKATKKEDFLEKQFHRLPVAFRAEVKSGLKLAVFLTSLRAYIEKTAPGLLEWGNRKHNGIAYVRISPTKAGREMLSDAPEKLAIFYVATPTSLTVSLNEDVLKRAIDREASRRKEKPGDKTAKRDAAKPWLGSSMNLQVDRNALEILQAAFDENYQELMQSRAWANIPVLNEWKRRYPDKDPVELHANIWKTRLRCPGGGNYVWNGKLQTMESTVYGSPVSPKTGAKLPAAMELVKGLNFGVTFENKGLRARLEMERGRR